MPKIAYVEKSFRPDTMKIIDSANAICTEYANQGFTLTLRQLYYQFVARGLIRNRDTEYKRLGSIVNDARLAGLIDWTHLEDRTRNLRSLAHWDSPADIMAAVEHSYRTDRWEDQDYRLEVWIEKDALVGVIEGVCEANDVPYFSCRGYTSQSEVWGAAQRLLRYIGQGQTPIILHLGDHDPSGLDMTRDVGDRLALFVGENVEIQRLALNWDQVTQYNPPPNPAKTTDARFVGYVRDWGEESWELDALDPPIISALIQEAIDNFKDEFRWSTSERLDESNRALLREARLQWSSVARFLRDGQEDQQGEDQDGDDEDDDEE